MLHRPLDWRLVAIATLATLLLLANVALAVNSILATFAQQPWDWRIFVGASRAAWAGDSPYILTPAPYQWSPFAAYALAVVDWMGPDVWRFIHLPAVLLFPTWRMRGLVAISYPFWFDVNTGNIMVFVAVLAVWAVRGNRWAGWGFLVLCIVVPRPVMLPVAAWLLWRQPEYRAMVVLFAVHGLAVLASGWGDEWLRAMLVSNRDALGDYNIGPTRLFGAWWFILGVPLGAWLWWRRRPGWAGLAVTPYVLPYYLLLGLARDHRE